MEGDGGPAATAEARYVGAKMSVWRDIKNCPVPKHCSSKKIALNIFSALENMGYEGAVTITAYGNTGNIRSDVLRNLNGTGITLKEVPPGEASYKKILVDMMLWALGNPAPANILLISGDSDFSYVLHQLRLRNYNILLAHPKKASPSGALVSAAKTVWLWTSLLAGGAPLPASNPGSGSTGTQSLAEGQSVRICDFAGTLDLAGDGDHSGGNGKRRRTRGSLGNQKSKPDQ